MKVHELISKIDERNNVDKICMFDENDNLISTLSYFRIVSSDRKIKDFSYSMNYTVKSFIIRDVVGKLSESELTIFVK